jgi:predicted TIM-barrel fold metal-dependent hydrolase
MVMPNDRIDAQLAAMEQNAAWGVDAWKTYPPWGSSRASGYWLDDAETGVRMIEKGRELAAVHNRPAVFCVHKGFPLTSFSRTYTDPREMGVVAKMFPDVTFVTYHSAFEHGLATAGQGTPDIEGPFDPEGKWDPNNPVKYPVTAGVNSFILSLLNNGIVPNDPSVRLYAEIGSTWPCLITRPVEGAHVLGKLLQYIGEDRIVWGTDCLWFGSPRPVIEAFRAFEIPVEMQEKYGYPALTKQAKAKILGVNAARIHKLDPCKQYPELTAFRRELEGEFGPRRYMMMPTPGPRTRREFLALRAEENREKQRFSGHSFLRKGIV